MTTKDKIFDLSNKVEKAKNKYSEKLVSVIMKYVRKYKEHPEEWDKGQEEILDLIYESLVETYSIMGAGLKKIYRRVPEFKVNKIGDLTYNKDGMTLEERVKSHWDWGKNVLASQDYDVFDIKCSLINKYERILFTETKVVEGKVKANKKPENASMLIIESGCENCPGGEYSADESVELPPYHPNCSCCYYYIVTDDEDDIHDLDLEIEE